MKKIFLLFIIFITAQNIADAQKISKPANDNFSTSKGLSNKIEFMKGSEIVCPANYEDMQTFVPYAKSEKDAKGKIKARSTFIVDYNGFSTQAKNAFQEAIDIWAGFVNSPVPIRVVAYWQPLEKNTLGSATPFDFTRNFPGQQKNRVWYPIALAEKIAGQELNSPGEYDVLARFNSDFNWSYSGTPASQQFDLTSVVLHELCHGLGFTGSWSVNANTGSWGRGTSSPFVYDTFLYNDSDNQLTDTLKFRNNSASLRSQLIGGKLLFNGPLTNAQNSSKPKIYAPSTYQAGSSISHLDDNTYRSGNENSLMTSKSNPQEVIRDVGPLVKSIFADMGWVSTSLIHDPIKSTEKALKNIDLSVKITSDNILTSGSYKVYYTENDEEIKNAKMLVLKSGNKPDIYTANIPITKPDAIIRYYFTVDDNTKTTYTAPAEAPSKGFFGFQVGAKDTRAPEIYAEAINFATPNSPLNITTLAEDNFQEGIDTLIVEYSINGAPKPSFGLRKFNLELDGAALSNGSLDAFFYIAKSPFGKVNVGDKIKYRFVATDKSSSKNKSFIPSYYDTPNLTNSKASGFYEIAIINPIVQTDVVDNYKTNFDDDKKDFASVGFSISDVAGFSNKALHSEHPYKNGGNIDAQSNLIALLTKPIKITDVVEDATISFDEVVLVEPGEPDSQYGDQEFYDYVVVEGSFNNGATWQEFDAGYDSNNFKTWASTFNGSIDRSTITGASDNQFETVDSKAIGNPKLFQNRVIDLLNPDYGFETGDVVLIRFRLFSDELSYGWGWAIDNLAIQTPLVTSVEPDLEAVLIYPNPTSNKLNLNFNLANDDKIGTLSFYDIKGKKFLEQNYEIKDKKFSQSIEISTLPSGTYYVRFKSKNNTISRKFIVTH